MGGIPALVLTAELRKAQGRSLPCCENVTPEGEKTGSGDGDKRRGPRKRRSGKGVNGEGSADKGAEAENANRTGNA